MTFLPAASDGLVSRSWNGTPISRRTTDGFVNATAMAKASGKQWSNYRETDRANTYMEALSRNTGIRVTDLYVSKPGDGTWIHPRLAVDFARWISAEFAVWMDAWFVEELEKRAASAVSTTPRLGAEGVLELVERSVVLFERLGGLDQRDELLFKDIVRTSVLAASSGAIQAIPSDEEMTLSDAWLEVFQQPLPREKYRSAGVLVANAYREDFKEEPPFRQQYVDGAVRKVKSYRRKWLMETLSRFKSQLTNS